MEEGYAARRESLWQRVQRVEMALARGTAVGGPNTTVWFWLVFGAFLAALWLTPILPLGDYPYHLALASILRRMFDPNAPERAIYETNLIGYNSLFQVAVAVVALVMPVRYAGLVVMTTSMVLFALGLRALLVACRRPTARTFLALPLFFTTPFAWGFTNYCLAMGLQLFTIARVIARPRGGVRLRYDVVTALLALLGAWSHVLATAVAYAILFFVLLARTYDDPEAFPFRVARTIREGLPLLPAVIGAVVVHVLQQRDPLQRAAPAPLVDAPAEPKLEAIYNLAGELLMSRLDRACVLVAAGLFLFCFVFRAPRAVGARSPGWPVFAVSFLAYVLLPRDGWTAFVLYPRIIPLMIVGLAVWAPPAAALVERGVTIGLGLVATASALLFADFRIANVREFRDLEHILRDAPPERAVTGVALDTSVARLWNAWAGHLAPYYVVEKGGESAVTYADKSYLPVRYKEGHMPALASAGLAQGTSSYSATSRYARHFDLVLVRSVEGEDARERLWPTHAQEIDVLAQRGRWWLFDARRFHDARRQDAHQDGR